MATLTEYMPVFITVGMSVCLCLCACTAVCLCVRARMFVCVCFCKEGGTQDVYFNASVDEGRGFLQCVTNTSDNELLERFGVSNADSFCGPLHLHTYKTS